MNRFILGLVAVAAIAAGASASTEAATALPVLTGGAAAGPSVRIGSRSDLIADLDRFDAVRSNAALRDSRVITSGVPGYDFRYRQFACIRIGHRIAC